jgi:hypothetical protein
LSRNRDRLGNHKVQAADQPPQTAHQPTSESSFSFVIPTEFVELPSKGRYYPAGHPLHNLETIEVKQMTAKEEDLLTSRALLKKGVALDRVIESLIVDKRIDHRTLFVGDRNAIMIAARISGYGNLYETSVQCPSCLAKQKYSFDLLDANVDHGAGEDNVLIAEDLGNGTFMTKLPRTKFEVVFKILNGSDEQSLLTMIDNDRRRKKEESYASRQLAAITVQVNGDDSAAAIDYFANNVPSIDAQHLRAAFTEASPNIDLTQLFSCEECGFETEMEVPLTADFFWPKR